VTRGELDGEAGQGTTAFAVEDHEAAAGSNLTLKQNFSRGRLAGAPDSRDRGDLVARARVGRSETAVEHPCAH
jgi:hypothetical protein